MNKHCKYCGKNIKGKAKSYDYYYFCNNIDCLDKYLNEPEKKLICQFCGNNKLYDYSICKCELPVPDEGIIN
jgi:hypothetical protein